MFWSAFLVSVFSSAIGRIVIIPVLERLRIYDLPNHRTVHSKPVIGMGGLVFITGYFSSLLYILYFQSPQFNDQLLTSLVAILGGGISIIILGAVDDLINLKPITKFSVECVVGFFLCQCGIIIEELNLLGLSWSLGALAVPFTILWIVGIINAMNMMDGLDGLSGSISLVILITMAIQQPDHPLVLLLFPGLIGGVIIFLFDNWHPAKIFMGDIGSLFLGYHIAVFSILILSFNATPMGAMAPLLLLGLPIVDTLWAMVRRAQLQKPIFQADKLHIHHQLLALNIPHKKVVITLIVVSTLLAILVYLGINSDTTNSTIISLGSLFIISYLIFHLHTVKHTRETAESKGYRAGIKDTIRQYLIVNKHRDNEIKGLCKIEHAESKVLIEKAHEIFIEKDSTRLQELSSNLFKDSDTD